MLFRSRTVRKESYTERVSAAEIDEYLAALGEPDRTALEALRTMILAAVPEAEQCISYGMPAFRVDGVVVAGFAAFAKHLSYFPHSGSVLEQVAEQVAGFDGTKGSLHFNPEHPLTAEQVALLVRTKLAEADRP